MYKDNSQLRIEDFVFPYGKLDPENDWVRLAALVPWEVAEERYAVRFVNNGHPAHPARTALGALLIQRRLKCRDQWLVKHIGENPYLQYFIGMKEYGPCPFGASTLVAFRKRFSEKDLAAILEASVPKGKAEEKDDSDDGNDPPKGDSIAAVRFGGYPEMVRAMSDAIYGGGSIDFIQNGNTYRLGSTPKAYRRQLSHDGAYATATLMINDEALSVKPQGEDDTEEDENEAASGKPEPPKPRKCYIFCPAKDKDSLFAEVDRKTSAPLLPDFRDYVLDELIARKILRRLNVFTLYEKLDAWTLELLPDEKNVVDVLEQGLKEGKIAIPGSDPAKPDGFDGVTGVTSYLNTFGVTVAERIRNQFVPLFDPASEPLSEEVLAVNDYIQEHAGYSLYDAQLAVAETVKRQLERRNAAFIVAECGTGKTKIGSTALGALHGLAAAQRRSGAQKTFNLVMCPSHVTRKWVREISETLPNTYAMVVRSITEFDRLYAMYEAGDKSVYAVFSKERARDGYMRYPAVTLKRYRKQRIFVCPDCGNPAYKGVDDYLLSCAAGA